MNTVFRQVFQSTPQLVMAVIDAAAERAETSESSPSAHQRRMQAALLRQLSAAYGALKLDAPEQLTVWEWMTRPGGSPHAYEPGPAVRRFLELFGRRPDVDSTGVSVEGALREFAYLHVVDLRGEVAAEHERVKAELERMSGLAHGDLERQLADAQEQIEIYRSEAGSVGEQLQREQQRVASLERDLEAMTAQAVDGLTVAPDSGEYEPLAVRDFSELQVDHIFDVVAAHGGSTGTGTLEALEALGFNLDGSTLRRWKDKMPQRWNAACERANGVAA